MASFRYAIGGLSGAVGEISNLTPFRAGFKGYQKNSLQVYLAVVFTNFIYMYTTRWYIPRYIVAKCLCL